MTVVHTVKTLIEAALREIKVLGVGEEADADMIENSKTILVDLIASFSVDGFKIPYLSIETWTLSSIKSTYTWGPLSDFASVAPNTANALEAVSWQISTQPIPLRSMSVRELLAMPNISQIGAPSAYMFDNQAVPIIRLDCYPLGGVLKTAARKPLDLSTAELTDDLTFPPSYNRFLRTNLAIDLCPGYNKEVGPTLSAVASSSRKAIMRVNAQPIPDMQSDVPGVASGRGYSNYAPLPGTWRG